MATNIWFWIGFNAFVLAMLALDLGVFHRTAHVVRPKEAGVWVAVWAALALLFAAGIWWWSGGHVALTFLTGYLIEQALSADNVFVIVLIFAYFGIPERYQHRVLFWGIVGALVMRGTFIGVGTALIARVHWVMYVFGAILVVTGVRMAFRDDDEFDAESNPVLKMAKRWLPLTHRYEGQHFYLFENGRRLFTPLFLVLVLVEFTDLIFAIDSIPAIFAVTRDPFVVYTSNVFAILGLRSMYFLLAHVVRKFAYLKYGLAVILSFVGLKMLLERFVAVPTWASLVVILVVLLASVAASFVWPPKPPDSERLPGDEAGG